MIFFYGDLHGKFSHVLETVHKHRPEAIVLLGDVQAQRPLELELDEVLCLTEIWWIQGNHDTDSHKDHDNLFQSALADRNLHGRVVEIDGIRIGGLGGIFREKIWWPVPMGTKPTQPGLDDFQRHLDEQLSYGLISREKYRGEMLKHQSTIFWRDWYGLYAKSADILVTHEAPSCHPHGFVAIDELASSMGVKQAFHGHQHDRLDYSAHRARLGFEAYGVGLRGVTNLHGDVIVEGVLDEKRSYRQKQVKIELIV